MHDFTLLNINVEWATGIAKIALLNNKSLEASIRIDGLILIKIPRLNEWGESISINSAKSGISSCGNMSLNIEMQSGDIIEIIAEKIALPD
ncbi:MULTISPECIES: hypothetical protein [Enterobacterales]|uniref:hypothetical protein n=1 Tax=Enterobacterales TaxID=91347 RepID=UPI002ED881C6